MDRRAETKHAKLKPRWFFHFRINTSGGKEYEMKNVEITTHGDFQVATVPGKNGFTSWAKMGKIKTDSPIKEPGNHVWFNFGKTRRQAREAILFELGLSHEGV